MTETQTTSPLSGEGPSGADHTADPTLPSRPQTLGKRPLQDEGEEADFDVTNPQHREDYLVFSSEDDASERLANYE
jgi:hypothetical protein